MQFTIWLTLPSIKVSRRGLISQTGKQYLDTNKESMKQLDKPESTRAWMGMGMEENESIISEW